MAFFGLTQYGITDPIKFFMRPDYIEPINPPNIIELLDSGKIKRPVHEVLRELDCYSGIFDGYAYGSIHRYLTHLKRRFRKPVGPSEIYRDPVTSSMCYGWFLTDPDLTSENWYKPDYVFTKPISERTKFFNAVLLQDENFVL